jgi:hypothetical protein
MLKIGTIMIEVSNNDRNKNEMKANPVISIVKSNMNNL